LQSDCSEREEAELSGHPPAEPAAAAGLSSVQIRPLQLGNYFSSAISSYLASIRIDNSRMNQEIKRFRLSSEVQSQNTPAEEDVWSFQFVVILMKAMAWRSVSFEIVIPHR
jgi:hypothetical protein